MENKTIGTDTAMPTGDHNNVQPDYGLTKREYIMIHTHCAILQGLLASVVGGEYHGWSPDDIANNALLQTDAIINALNNNQ